MYNMINYRLSPEMCNSLVMVYKPFLLCRTWFIVGLYKSSHYQNWLQVCNMSFAHKIIRKSVNPVNFNGPVWWIAIGLNRSTKAYTMDASNNWIAIAAELVI